MEQKYIIIVAVIIVVLIILCILFFHSNGSTFPLRFYYNINKQFQLYGVNMPENLLSVTPPSDQTNQVNPPANTQVNPPANTQVNPPANTQVNNNIIDVDHENFVGNLYSDAPCTKVVGIIIATLEKQNYVDIEYSLVSYSIRIQPPELRGKVDEQGRPLFNFDNNDSAIKRATPTNSLYLTANRIIQPNKGNVNVLPPEVSIFGIVNGGTGFYGNVSFKKFELISLSETLRFITLN